MASSSSLLLLHKPTCNFCFCASYAPAYITSNRFRSSNCIFPLNRRKIWSVSGPRIMANLVKTNVQRDSEERFQAFEQESLITDSSEFQNELVSNAGGGIEAVANRLIKWIVATLFGLVLLIRHDGAALWAVIGSVSNSALSVALKRLLNQERPVATLRSDPGMPSSHAQSISFISVFTVLSVIEWLGTNEVSLFLSSLILALGSYFVPLSWVSIVVHWASASVDPYLHNQTWLRVSQKLHTTSQVVVGAIVGSVYSILWYITWNSLFLEAFTSSFSVQIAVFLATAASALGFALYVLLNWFKDDR